MLAGVAADEDLYQAVSSSLPITSFFRYSGHSSQNVSHVLHSKGEDPDFSEALIVRNNSTIEDVCDQVHRTLKETFKYAMVWGASARHVPQRVGLGHVVADEDVVSIVAK